MAEFDMPKAGEVCWRELRTTNLEKAVDFYSSLFNWTIEQTKVTEMPYKEIIVDGKAVGGMMVIDENWGPEPPPTHWASYVAVDSADETAAKITANGGSVRVSPFDAPGVGRMAMVADPSGADFAIIQFAVPA